MPTTKDKDYLELLELKTKKESLKNSLQEVEKKLDKKEKELLDRLHSGETIDWCWEYHIYRTNISWKDLFVKYVNKKEADLISAKVPTTVYPHIGIFGFDDPEEKIPITNNVKKKIRRFKLRKK